MKHYTDTISVSLAEKLKEKGMPIDVRLYTELGIEPSEAEVRYCAPTFGACFDWLMSRDFTFYIDSVYQEREKIGYSYYLWDSDLEPYYDNGFKTWHEAAEKAIEKALTLI